MKSKHEISTRLRYELGGVSSQIGIEHLLCVLGAVYSVPLYSSPHTPPPCRSGA